MSFIAEEVSTSGEGKYRLTVGPNVSYVFTNEDVVKLVAQHLDITEEEAQRRLFNVSPDAPMLGGKRRQA